TVNLSGLTPILIKYKDGLMISSPTSLASSPSTSLPSIFDPAVYVRMRVEVMNKLIQKGDKIPDVKLQRFNKEGKQEPFSTLSDLSEKRVVLFTVPGAFTPVCSRDHLPGFVKNADAIKALGVDKIVCVATNTLDIMRAWGEKYDPEGKI